MLFISKRNGEPVTAVQILTPTVHECFRHWICSEELPLGKSISRKCSDGKKGLHRKIIGKDLGRAWNPISSQIVSKSRESVRVYRINSLNTLF
jgi:hypothetical protein